MATIGTFTQNDDGSYTGAIKTLDLNVRQAHLRPVEKTSSKSPDFRIFANGSELGAGWKKTSQDNNPYISVKLDDPSLRAPIYARLMDAEEGYELVWSRRQTMN